MSAFKHTLKYLSEAISLAVFQVIYDAELKKFIQLSFEVHWY